MSHFSVTSMSGCSYWTRFVFVLQNFWMTWWLTHVTSLAPCLIQWHPLYFWSSTALNEASRNRSWQPVRRYRRTHYSCHQKVWTPLVKIWNKYEQLEATDGILLHLFGVFELCFVPTTKTFHGIFQGCWCQLIIDLEPIAEEWGFYCMIGLV